MRGGEGLTANLIRRQTSKQNKKAKIPKQITIEKTEGIWLSKQSKNFKLIRANYIPQRICGYYKKKKIRTLLRSL